MEDHARSDADVRAERRANELKEIVVDVEARLRKVCEHLPNGEFQQLVLKIARGKQRHRGRDPTRPLASSEGDSALG